MILFDWTALLAGLGIGTLTSAAFFAGLGLGLRVTLRSARRPGWSFGVLMLSAAVRMSALLGIGWLVAVEGGPWALAGFALAFLVVRFTATTIARVSIKGRTP